MNTARARIPRLGHDKLKLLAIIAVAGIPVVAAMVMYFGKFIVPEGTTNHGQLILPPLDAASLVDVDHSLDTPAPWTLLTIGNTICEAVCQESLYKIQQVNIALGREANRVRHMLLAPEAMKQESENLRQKYPNLQIRQVNTQQINDLLKDHSDLQPQAYDVYLVDPLGNLMMRYSNKQPGKAMLEDLKKLLRLSKIG